MKCATVLHGGECHRTSTPRKSGNKIKEKKIIYFYPPKISTTLLIVVHHPIVQV